MQNLYRPQGDPSRLQHVLHPALPEPLSPEDSRVIQCGADNPYGHPTPETLERLQKTGAKIFRNDEDGDVIVTIKDEQVDVAVTKP